MHILIDDSIIEANLSPLDIRGLRMLADAYEEGLHIISGSRRTLKFVKDLDALEHSTKEVYGHLYSSFTTRPSPINAMSVNCIAHSGNDKPVTDGQNIIISLGWITMGAVREPSTLIGENLTDCELLVLIARHYLTRLDLGLKINANLLPGGGSTIHQIYSHIQTSQNRFALCVVDSDASFPGKLASGTSKKLLSVEDFNSPNTQIYVIDAMESENLLPTCLMFDLDINKSASIETLRAIRQNDNDRFAQHLDIKKGLRKSTCELTAKGNHLADFYKRFYETTISNMSLPDYTSQPDGDAWLLFPLGDNLLSDSLRNLNIDDYAVIDESIQTENLANDWETIGRLVASWCIASERRFLS